MEKRTSHPFLINFNNRKANPSKSYLKRHLLKFLLKQSIISFRNLTAQKNVKLARSDVVWKTTPANCQFFLNFDLDSSCKPNFLKITESNNLFYVFSIFGSLKYAETLIQNHSNLFVVCVFPLDSQNNDSKISSLLGLKEAEWEYLEASLSRKFDRLAKKLI